jgi:hypothetical protein
MAQAGADSLAPLPKRRDGLIHGKHANLEPMAIAKPKMARAKSAMKKSGQSRPLPHTWDFTWDFTVYLRHHGDHLPG